MALLGKFFLMQNVHPTHWLGIGFIASTASVCRVCCYGTSSHTADVNLRARPGRTPGM